MKRGGGGTVFDVSTFACNSFSIRDQIVTWPTENIELAGKRWLESSRVDQVACKRD